MTRQVIDLPRQSHMPRPVASISQFGSILRGWRDARRMSQLDLAMSADVSPRHLSCLETGKAQPGRQIVVRLAETLDVPLRDRNALLMAAGYAPIYPETALTTAPLAEVRCAIDLLLEQQEPYPAILLDRHWNMLQTNRGMDRVVRRVLGGRSSAHDNMIRQIFDPADVRATIVNWDEVARSVIGNFQHMLASSPTDSAGRALLAEALAYPGVPTRWRDLDLASPPAPLLTTVMRDGTEHLTFFSTITTFAMARDVTLEELRIECCFPIDERTRRVCREMAQVEAE